MGRINWGLAGLTAVTLAVALPFVAFVIFAAVEPVGPPAGRQRAASERAQVVREAPPTTSARGAIPVEPARRTRS
jgi:hypothetical protein